MSNNLVGSVYNTIIEEVVNSSRVDFEESAVEESVLELLRVGWQRKLTQLDVARFPWDPKPEPPPPAPQAQAAQPPPSSAPAHSQARFSPQLPLPNAGQQASQPGPSAQNGIKTEPGLKAEPNVAVKQEPGTQQQQQYQNFNGAADKNSVAANRAAQQLQAQYGIRAAGSINALQSQQPQHPQGQGQSQSPPPPTQAQAAAQAQQQMYRQQMAAATAQMQLQQQRNGQTDGPGDFDSDSDEDADFEGVLMQRNANGDLNELGRVEIDRMLHERIAAKAKSMEGGGLMLPLEEATRHQTASARRSRSKGKGVAAFDGGDDDEEEDEDAINSDLDDSEDDNADDDVDDDGGLGHIMLCMYDKVQRVKNKWKCTLKDGVLTVNGKEYVFHKATGEYEW